MVQERQSNKGLQKKSKRILICYFFRIDSPIWLGNWRCSSSRSDFWFTLTNPSSSWRRTAPTWGPKSKRKTNSSGDTTKSCHIGRQCCRLVLIPKLCQTLYLRFRKIRCLNFWIILIYFYNFIQCHSLTVEAANQIMANVVIRLLLSYFIGHITVDYKNSSWLFFASG